MPIEKGREWGGRRAFPADAPRVGTDAAAAELVTQGRRVMTVEGGDLARTLGVRSPLSRTPEMHVVEIDAIEVALDDAEARVAVAHVMVGRAPRAASWTAIMNAAFVGTRNIAPRAHPGDGKLDVVTVELDAIDRVRAWRRMPTAQHVPHPGITIRRHSDGELSFSRPQPVRIDGVRVGRAKRVRYRVLPEALEVALS